MDIGRELRVIEATEDRPTEIQEAPIVAPAGGFDARETSPVERQKPSA